MLSLEHIKYDVYYIYIYIYIDIDIHTQNIISICTDLKYQWCVCNKNNFQSPQ